MYYEFEFKLKPIYCSTDYTFKIKNNNWSIQFK